MKVEVAGPFTKVPWLGRAALGVQLLYAACLLSEHLTKVDRAYEYGILAAIGGIPDSALGLFEEGGHLMLERAESADPRLLLAIQRAACAELARRDAMEAA